MTCFLANAKLHLQFVGCLSIELRLDTNAMLLQDIAPFAGTSHPAPTMAKGPTVFLFLPLFAQTSKRARGGEGFGSFLPLSS